MSYLRRQIGRDCLRWYSTSFTCRGSEVRVLYCPPSCTVDRTEPFRATFSVALPGIRLSSGIGTVYRMRASPGMTMISLTNDSMKALRSVNSLSFRKSPHVLGVGGDSLHVVQVRPALGEDRSCIRRRVPQDAPSLPVLFNSV